MFRTFRVPFEMSDRRPLGVNALHKTRAGKIWAATEVGLYLVLHEEGGDWRLEKNEPEPWRDKNVETTRIEEDRFGRLWLVSAIGIFVFNPASGEHFKALESSGVGIVEDNQGRIWTGGGVTPNQQGLHLFELPARTVRRFCPATLPPPTD
jgi:ligand-binding sensor domain-containing protein